MADPIIKIGSKGAAVKKAQKALNNRGEWLTVDAVRLIQEIFKDQGIADYDPGPIDGKFGSLTEKAVKEYQSDYSLPIDGIVGEKTWSALWS